MNPAVSPRPANHQTTILLNILTVWHALFCLIGIASIIFLWGNANLAAWVRILATITLSAATLASAFTVFLIPSRNHRGRVISLVINYLGFLICFLYELHVLGIFLGIDSLAGTFGKGLPYLLGVLVGYLVIAFGDRFENYPSRKQFFNNAGRWVMIVFGILALYAVGIIPGTLSLLSRFNKPLPFALLFGILLFGFLLWAMWRHPSAEAMNAKNTHKEMLDGYLFLSPNLLGFLFFFAGPLILSFYTSFTNWDAFSTRDWIGLDNYAKIFSLDFKQLTDPNQPFPDVLDSTIYSELTRFNLFGKSFIIGARDKLFWIALRNTVVFSLMAVPLSVIPALFLANLLNSRLPGMKFFRAVYFLPSIAAVVGVALIWQWLYNAAVGYINYAITSLVNILNSLPGVVLVDPQIRWLSDTRTALLAVVIMAAWQWIGLNTVLFLAGLQNIPRELYEAATVDGAGKWGQFWHVTVPLLAPTTFFVITTAIINALQLFEQVYVLIPTEPPGGPNNATISLVLYLYQKGFQRFEQGYASAVAWVLFIAIFSITLLQYLRQRRTTAYTG